MGLSVDQIKRIFQRMKEPAPLPNIKIKRLTKTRKVELLYTPRKKE